MQALDAQMLETWSGGTGSRGCEGSERLMLDRAKAYTDQYHSVSP
jgi:hypothetical protein